MVPLPRPKVPVFSNSKMPRADMRDEEKARLCSVYFRPWTLCTDFDAIPHVPHWLQMPLYPEPVVRHRRRAKGKAAATETAASWASSWARYIRGNVVSDHAAVLIRRFLSLTLARRSGDHAQNSDNGSESAMDDMEGNGAVAVKVSLDDAHDILRLKTEGEDGTKEDTGKEISKRQKKSTGRRSKKWSGDLNRDGPWDSSGNIETSLIEEYKKAARSLAKNSGDKAQRSSLSQSRALVCAHVNAKCVIVRVLVAAYVRRDAREKTHQAVKNGNFKKKARASIYSHGGIVGIRTWLEALQAFLLVDAP